MWWKCTHRLVLEMSTMVFFMDATIRVCISTSRLVVRSVRMSKLFGAAAFMDWKKLSKLNSIKSMKLRTAVFVSLHQHNVW